MSVEATWERLQRIVQRTEGWELRLPDNTRSWQTTAGGRLFGSARWSVQDGYIRFYSGGIVPIRKRACDPIQTLKAIRAEVAKEEASAIRAQEEAAMQAARRVREGNLRRKMLSSGQVSVGSADVVVRFQGPFTDDQVLYLDRIVARLERERKTGEALSVYEMLER